jgi:hypothetical protein
MGRGLSDQERWLLHRITRPYGPGDLVKEWYGESLSPPRPPVQRAGSGRPGLALVPSAPGRRCAARASGMPCFAGRAVSAPLSVDMYIVKQRPGATRPPWSRRSTMYISTGGPVSPPHPRS